MDIRFDEHASFHRAAAGMVGGALATGIALHALAEAPLIGGVAGVAIGAAWGYGRARARLAAAVLALVPLIAASAGWVAGLPTAVPLVASAALLALGLAAGGPRGVRGALGVGLAALVALVAMWCALRVANARETVAWPAWFRAGAAAAAMGMVGVLATLPRHLRVAIDPIRSVVRQLPTGLDPEVRGLCDRALAIWAAAKDELGDPTGQQLVRDGVTKTLEVAARSAEIKAAGASDAELARRMEELDAKIAATIDAEAKQQYEAARAALDDQRRYRAHIARGRERLVARMHNHVAALEKFQLAATGLEAARQTTAGSVAIRQLEELSADVTASGEALAELELGPAAAQA